MHRINELAKKFPKTAQESEEAPVIEPEPKENEKVFSEVQTLRNEIKWSEKMLDEKKCKLNAIINRDKKNKRDLKHIERITRKIEGIRHTTKKLNMDKANMQEERNKHVDHLHHFGAQLREAQRESIRDAHSRV